MEQVNELPPEIWQMVLSFLDVKSLLRMAAVNKFFRENVEDSFRFKRVLRTDLFSPTKKNIRTARRLLKKVSHRIEWIDFGPKTDTILQANKHIMFTVLCNFPKLDRKRFKDWTNENKLAAINIRGATVVDEVKELVCCGAANYDKDLFFKLKNLNEITIKLDDSMVWLTSNLSKRADDMTKPTSLVLDIDSNYIRLNEEISRSRLVGLTSGLNNIWKDIYIDFVFSRWLTLAGLSWFACELDAHNLHLLLFDIAHSRAKIHCSITGPWDFIYAVQDEGIGYDIDRMLITENGKRLRSEDRYVDVEYDIEYDLTDMGLESLSMYVIDRNCNWVIDTIHKMHWYTKSLQLIFNYPSTLFLLPRLVKKRNRDLTLHLTFVCEIPILLSLHVEAMASKYKLVIVDVYNVESKKWIDETYKDTAVGANVIYNYI